ncbi:hypothetical protein EKO27_g990 [Xylaria grammica]|uniref:Ubiquitin 3 binding protein But2 C-terminal domain-containing protein n=1 Tax=Xylaria grammica TaxID=363999 RepID=A0A439DID4_9PEZI|nr:hypothetical protein EKO27_g990 [Xylaria grammica]
MKFSTAIASLLLAACGVVAQDDDDYIDINWDWTGSGKIYLVEGYGTWRGQYVTPVSGIPVGCLNENGNLVADEGDNCAVFYVDGYPGEHLRTEKNDFLCGYADYFNCIGDGYPGLTTLWTYVVPPPTYISGYVPGVDSTAIFTWFVDHTPTNATEEILLEFRLPVNPDDPTTNPPPGASTFGVVMQWVPE